MQRGIDAELPVGQPPLQSSVVVFMSMVAFLWAVVIGACATMALPHLLIGIKHRAWQNLFFALAALSGAGIAFGELAMMCSRTAEQIGRAQQWTHLPIFFLAVAIVGFIRLNFGTGRLWLGISGCVLRAVVLVINFARPPNVNFRAVTGLRHLNFLGDTVATPEGVPNPWTHLGELSSFLILAFVLDATVTLWRRGRGEDRRRAITVGGSIMLFIVLAAGLSALINARAIHAPYLISLPFMGVIVAMGFELSYDILRAAQTAQQLRTSEGALRESEVRMSLAANAGHLGLWMWDTRGMMFG
jgi:two-component system, LuxR family, sensor kinase FixL